MFSNSIAQSSTTTLSVDELTILINDILDVHTVNRILRNDVTLTKLKLSYKKITDAQFQVLMRLLANNTKITTLDVSGNNLSTESAKLLALNPTLQHLDLSRNAIDEDGACLLAGNHKLLSLNLNSNNPYYLEHSQKYRTTSHTIEAQCSTLKAQNLKKIGDKAAKAFALNKTLQYLDVSCNDIGTDGVIELAGNNTLKSLNIHSNHMISLSAVIALAINKTLRYLSVNNISPEGVEMLAATRTLEYLNVNSNSINRQVLVTLAANESIKSLDVSDCKIDDDGVSILARNQTFKELIIACNNMGPKGAKSLAENSIIKNLDISWNKIGDNGMVPLAASATLDTLCADMTGLGIASLNALRVNRSIKGLSIASNDIDDVGAEIISGNQVIEKLIIHDNKITNTGAEYLAGNKIFRDLDVGANEIKDDGAKKIAANSFLKKVDMSANKIGKEGLIALLANKKFKRLFCVSNDMEIDVFDLNALTRNKTLRKLNITCTIRNDSIKKLVLDSIAKNRAFYYSLLPTAIVFNQLAHNNDKYHHVFRNYVFFWIMAWVFEMENLSNEMIANVEKVSVSCRRIYAKKADALLFSQSVSSNSWVDASEKTVSLKK